MASNDGNSSDEGELFASLFVDESYVKCSFEFGSSLPSATTILCSTAASTDYDLTGQVVWPVSVFLTWFIVQRPEFFIGQHVVELGAGCGLPGLVAARVGAASSHLTDGSTVVCRLLERQKEAFDLASYPGSGPIGVLKLEWGTLEGVNALRQKLNAGSLGSRGDQHVRPSVVIGADVVCWPSCVQPLLQSVKALFLDLDDPFLGVMFIGYVCRATDTRDLFFEQARLMGFTFEKIPADDFLPLSSESASNLLPTGGVEASTDQSNVAPDYDHQRGWPKNVRSVYDLELYRLSLDPFQKSLACLPPVLDYKGETHAAPF
jgi:hypothetical protein